jgi:TonB-dependent starch-binding outer membrane protein SusC
MINVMKKTRKFFGHFNLCPEILIIGALFFLNLQVFSQTSIVRGKITDSQTGELLPGVNVVIKGTTIGIISGVDGSYQINSPSTNAILQFSFLGYAAQEIPVSGRTEINVSLVTDTKLLNEVVAIGYGTVKRKDLTGSVASISGEELKKVPMANAAEAMKGRLPGVNVLTTDGSPDAEVVIRVRGGGSVTQDNSPLFVVDGFIVGSIRDIPPTDITSISVLKDAAATAIYGAQAANGVIVVTTRKPVAGKTTVSYNGYMQWKQLPANRKLEVLSPYEYVLAQYEYAAMQGSTNLSTFEKFYGKYDDLELYQYKKPTDWQQELFGNPKLSQLHNVSISGGSEMTKINLSITNNNDEGILVGSGYKRTVINFKLNQQISKKLLFEASSRITNTVVNGAGTAGGSQLRVKDAIATRPVNGIADELDIDLTTLDSNDDYQSFLLNLINPLKLAEQDWRKRTTQNYVLNGGITWDPIENLSLKTVFTSEKTFDESLRFYGPLTSESQQNGSSLPLGTKSESNDFSYRWLNTVNYVFKDLGAHQLDFLIGQEIYSNGGKANFVRVEDFRVSMQPAELFANMALGRTDQHSTSEDTDQNRFSLFGRVNYQLNKKYLVTATLRSDESSKFSKKNRLGLFPAVALAWKMSEEKFIKKISFIDELKLRASYGETGNDRISATATQFLFSPSTTRGPGFGTNDYNVYYSPEGSTLYNPNLVWETTINRNAGLDFIMLKGGIRGNVDLYSNTTKNLLLASAISPISGFNTQWNNIGSTSNKGVEVALNTYIIDKKDISLSFNLNMGYNKSNIDELDGTNERFYQSNWASTDLKDRDDYYLRVGSTIGLIYGYVTDGMYSVDDFSGYDALTKRYILKQGIPDDKNTLGVSSVKPGFLKLKDIAGGADGGPDGIINSQDRKVIGSALPKATGGFGFDATFKGFDASIMFNWSLGNDVYNTGKIEFNQLYRTTYGNMLNTMNSSNRFTYIDFDGSITGTPGQVVTDLEQLRQMNVGKTIWNGSNSFGTATAVIHSWAVEDGSFLRLNTLTLGYSIPKTILDKIKLSQLRVYVTGYNLWLWTKYSGYDPEVSTTRSSSYASLTPGVDYSAYPRSRSLTFGVNVSF